MSNPTGTNPMIADGRIQAFADRVNALLGMPESLRFTYEAVLTKRDLKSPSAPRYALNKSFDDVIINDANIADDYVCKYILLFVMDRPPIKNDCTVHNFSLRKAKKIQALAKSNVENVVHGVRLKSTETRADEIRVVWISQKALDFVRDDPTAGTTEEIGLDSAAVNAFTKKSNNSDNAPGFTQWLGSFFRGGGSKNHVSDAGSIGRVFVATAQSTANDSDDSIAPPPSKKRKRDDSGGDDATG